MRLVSFIIFAATFFAVCATKTFAQNETEKEPRILLLVDGSSSMLKEWTPNDIRFQAAAKIIDKLMDSVYKVNKDVEFALRVYGHTHPTVDNYCYDTELEVRFSKNNYTQMMLRMAALHPLGVSPIAYSLKEAAEEDLVNTHQYKYSLILITDGGESCEGNICKVMEELLKKKIDFKPYILSLVDYAPLKGQYDCLGEYLLVTKPDDIEPTVGKIVDAYRTTFIQPRSVTKLINTAINNSPSVLKVNTPAFNIDTKIEDDPQPEPVKETPKEQPKPVVVTPPPVLKPEPKPVVVTPKEEPKPVVVTPPKEEPKPTKIQVQDVKTPRQPDILATVPVRKGARMLPVKYFSPSFNRLPIAPYVPYFETEAPAVVKSAPKPMTPPTPMTPPVAINTPPKEVVYKPMNPVTEKKPTPKPVVNTPPSTPPTEKTYSVNREDAKETTLEILFWDGKGTYYETTPEVVLLDPKTGKELYKFWRTITATGAPQPQKAIPPGTYDITITGKKDYLVRNIEIRANQKNIYRLEAAPASLSFFYLGNKDRPVKEYFARVSVAIRKGQIVKQSCTEQLQYPPENYHVEVNTNPISVFNVDLEMGAVMELSIEEDGQIKISNPNKYPLQFQYQHGELYESFQPMNVKGSDSNMEFLIQPGRYKLIYQKMGKPVIKPFIIKSNMIAELTLD